MSNLIVIDGENKFYGKDCIDFKPLEDGTITGDPKYCNWSIDCKQTNILGVGYISDWYKFFNHDTGEEAFDYFCTGMFGEKDEGKEDKEVS